MSSYVEIWVAMGKFSGTEQLILTLRARERTGIL